MWLAALLIGVFLLCIVAVTMILFVRYMRKSIDDSITFQSQMEPVELIEVSTDYAPIADKESVSQSEFHRSLSSSILSKDSDVWIIDYNALEIEEEVGKGAYGVVYKAKWRAISGSLSNMAQFNQKKSPQKKWQ